MTPAWLPIRYREFYDVPRIFVVDAGEACLVFDCTFDDALGEYPSTYRVFRLPADAEVPDGSWSHITGGAELAVEIPVGAVTFDATRRAAIDAAVLSAIAETGR